MVQINLGGKKSYVSAAELTSGDKLKLLNAGELSESKFTYPDGNPKKELLFDVEINGETKKLKCNKFSQEELSNEWGTDTEAWKGKEVLVTKELVRSLGKDMIILKPVIWEE